MPDTKNQDQPTVILYFRYQAVIANPLFAELAEF